MRNHVPQRRTMAIGCAAVCVLIAAVVGSRAGGDPAAGSLVQQPLEYDGLYHLHRVPRKRLVRGLRDPIPAWVPSKPSRSALVMTAARDRNRVDMIEAQLRQAKQQMLAAHAAEEHRGLMAQSRHGSARLFRLLSHQKQDEKRALAMASEDFEAPPPRAAGSRPEALPAQEEAATSASPAEDPRARVEQHGQAHAADSAREMRQAGMGALDLVPEKDENVLGSLGGQEDLDDLNRDGSLSSSSDDRNTLGSLFAVRAPSKEAEEEAEKGRPESALSFRYRAGHWSRDGLVWIVGDGERRPYRAQKELKTGLANVAHGKDARRGGAASERRRGLDTDAGVPALRHKLSGMKRELQRMQTAHPPDMAKSAAAAAAAQAAKPDAATKASGPVQARPKVARAQAKQARAQAKRELRTGPLSLKRLLKDFGQYEHAIASFFSDDSHTKAPPKFAHAKRAWAKPLAHDRSGAYWHSGIVS
jgi:hypothetical protein